MFDKEGDEAPDIIPGDIIFNIKTLLDPMFTREGDDLYIKETISLIDVRSKSFHLISLLFRLHPFLIF